MALSNERILSQMTEKDWQDLWTLAIRSRSIFVLIKELRRHVYGACLLGILQELVSLIPMFVLYKRGIFLESIKHGDHRTVWELMVMADFVNSQMSNPRCDINHIDGIFRNHFAKIPLISPKTGESDSNGGRDGNTHNRGCPVCRIIGLWVSDMGRLPGLAAGYAEAIARYEWGGLELRKRPIGISLYGEGAEQQGDIHELRNRIAANNYKYENVEQIIKRYGDHWVDNVTKETGIVRLSPNILVVNENTKALFADAIDEHGNSKLHLRALGYGTMKGKEVHDWDIPRMFEVFDEAVTDAQSGIASLIDVKSYRGTAHNEDQIFHDPDAVANKDFGKAVRIAGMDDLTEFHEAWKRDPVRKILREYLIDIRVADTALLEEIEEKELAAMDARAKRILSEPDVTVEYDKRDRTIFPFIDWSRYPLEKPVSENPKTKLMGHNEAFVWILDQLMQENDRVVYFGEDVYQGGVLGLTKGLGKKFGPRRIWNMPISESDGVLNAAGFGFYGLKAWLEFQFGWFSRDADAAIAATALQWSQKKLKMNYRMVFPCGIVRSGGSAQCHEEWMEKWLWEKKGVAIVCPADAYELVGLMRACNEFEGPVAILLQISAGNLPEFYELAMNYATGVLNTSVPGAYGVPLEPYIIPFGKARIVRQGKDITVIVYGAASVHAVKNEADFLEKEEGISVEVVNPRTLRPLDTETICASVAKTGRAIVFHEASEETGLSPKIIAALVDEQGVMDSLRVRYIKAITAGMEGDIFIPTAQELVWARLPYYKTEIDLTDEKGRPIKRDIHRSTKLAHYIRDMVLNYR